jgi:hypothetical protein
MVKMDQLEVQLMEKLVQQVPPVQQAQQVLLVQKVKPAQQELLVQKVKPAQQELLE